MHESIGVNLRVTGHCSQGGRKYMEDMFAVAYQRSADGKDLEYAYFGIFDGHGGREAAMFAKKHLMDYIVEQKNFWSKDDEEVLKAIKDGFIQTHHAMWKEVGKWPKTSSGLPSTAGTTASIAFIKKGKLYIGHVGDSAIVLGYKEPGSKNFGAQRLTRDHKPGSPSEKQRIENLGGCVMAKSGVQRVVWNRPRVGHKGPVRRSTHIDQIPFLAVARSLGDLWSYSYEQEEFIVSPEPDVSVMTIDVKRDRCIILGSDGLWNMIVPDQAVCSIQQTEIENDNSLIDSIFSSSIDGYYCPLVKRPWVNPSKLLVEQGITRWLSLKMRADNTSVVTVMIDPPGPPRVEVLRKQYLMKKLRPREEVDRTDNMTLVCDYPMNPRNRSSFQHIPDSHLTTTAENDRIPKSLIPLNSNSENVDFEPNHSADVLPKPDSPIDFADSSSYFMEKLKVLSQKTSPVGTDMASVVDQNCEPGTSITTNSLSSENLSPDNNDDEQHRQKGTKRKILDHSPDRIKFHKSEKINIGARTCQGDLDPYTKPCTRSRIRCS